jgi:hypothetical protein
MRLVTVLKRVAEWFSMVLGLWIFILVGLMSFVILPPQYFVKELVATGLLAVVIGLVGIRYHLIDRLKAIHADTEHIRAVDSFQEDMHERSQREQAVKDNPSRR